MINPQPLTEDTLIDNDDTKDNEHQILIWSDDGDVIDEPVARLSDVLSAIALLREKIKNYPYDCGECLDNTLNFIDEAFPIAKEEKK